MGQPYNPAVGKRTSISMARIFHSHRSTSCTARNSHPLCRRTSSRTCARAPCSDSPHRNTLPETSYYTGRPESCRSSRPVPARSTSSRSCSSLVHPSCIPHGTSPVLSPPETQEATQLSLSQLPESKLRCGLKWFSISNVECGWIGAG